MEPRIDPNVKFTEADVKLMAEKNGASAAANWLLLLSPDQFDGDYWKVYDDLKRGAIDDK